jgi:hypothetical protein
MATFYTDPSIAQRAVAQQPFNPARSGGAQRKG